MFTVKYRETHYVTILDMYERHPNFNVSQNTSSGIMLVVTKKVFDKFELTGITNDNRQ